MQIRRDINKDKIKYYSADVELTPLNYRQYFPLNEALYEETEFTIGLGGYC